MSNECPFEAAKNWLNITEILQVDHFYHEGVDDFEWHTHQNYPYFGSDAGPWPEYRTLLNCRC